MKVLVLQVRIGSSDLNALHGTGYSTWQKFEQNVCMLSVKKWASKNNYDYKLVTQSSISNIEFFPSNNHRYAAERLMHFNFTEYDYLIYIDSDIFIMNSAPEFNLIPGLSIAKENDGTQKASEWMVDRYTKYLKDFRKAYYNSGVLCMDKETGHSIYEFFINKLQNHDNTDIEFADQDVINQWIVHNTCNILDQKWNYFARNYLCAPFHDKDFLKKNQKHIQNEDFTNMSQSYFIHFLGESKFFCREMFKKINHK